MPEIFNKIDKIKPAYDLVYKAVMTDLQAASGCGYCDHIHVCCRPLRFLYSRPGLE